MHYGEEHELSAPTNPRLAYGAAGAAVDRQGLGWGSTRTRTATLVRAITHMLDVVIPTQEHRYKRTARISE
jgi:hypothetical protein